MKRYLQFILISFSIVVAVMFFNLYQGQGEKNEKNISTTDYGKSYFLQPLSFNFTQSIPVTYPKLIRPINNIEYLREKISEWKWDKSIKNNWEFLLSKRIIILQKYLKAEIVGNYENVPQLIDWYKTIVPEDWEFWKFRDNESWEASLAQYYMILDEEIDYLKTNVADEAEKIKTAVKISGIMLTHKNDLDWVFKDWPMENDERIYLREMRDDVFKELSVKVKNIVQISDVNGLYYSLMPIISARNYGEYNLWFETNWYDKHNGNEQKIEAEIWENTNPKLTWHVVFDRYGLSLGRMTVSEKTKQLAIIIRIPGNITYNEPPRILLKKVTNNLNLNSSSNNKQTTVFDKRLYLLRFISFFILPLILVYVYIKRRYLLIKLFSPKKLCEFKQKSFIFFLKYFDRKYSFLLASFYTTGVYLGWKNWDFLAVLTFIFWTTISFIWNLNSVYSFFVSLLLIVLSFAAMVFKFDRWIEILSVYSFFFILSGALQLLFEESRNKLFKKEKSMLYKDVINTLFSSIALIIFLLISIRIIAEILFYRDYYADQYLNKFIFSVVLKMVGLWILAIVLTRFVDALFKKIIFINKIINKNYISLKILLTVVLFIAIYIIDIKLFKFIRLPFENNPYIYSVIPAKGTQGSVIEMEGHNFRTDGSLFLNGVQQKILKWSDKKIVFLLTDELSDSGLLKVNNSFEGKPLDSNSLMFTFIDTSPPAEFELDL